MSSVRAVHLPQSELVSEEPSGWDLKLLIPVVFLVAIGLAMVYSASIPVTTLKGKSSLTYLFKEATIILPGIVVTYCAMRYSLPRLQERAPMLYALGIALLIGVHLIGKTVNNAKSWYGIPGTPLSFQPSELMKLILVIALARYFAKFPYGLRSIKQMLPPLVILGLPCLLILKEPDMGTVAVIGLAMLIFFHLAGVKFRYLLLVALLAGSVVAMKIYHEPYQWDRIKNWIHPDPKAEMAGNYQITRSLIALGSGGLTGRGYCKGVEKYYYLPEATTDAIFAVMGEELGFLATGVVVFLFGCLVWRGLRVAGQAEDRFAGLLAAGITCTFGVQALLNIAVITGALPTTGVTLPFISYGGSSLLFSLAGVGLLLNVARGKRQPRATRIKI